MGSLVRLLLTLTVISLLTPSSEGVKCYECQQCEKDPGKTLECEDHCVEGAITEKNGPSTIARGCGRPGKDAASGGCEPFIDKGTDKKPEMKGEICGCNQDLCNLNLIGKTGGKKNGSYKLSCQWISLAVSALITISVNIFSS